MRRHRPRVAPILSLLLAGAASAGEAPRLVAAGNPDAPRDALTPAQEHALWSGIQRNVATLRASGKVAAPDGAATVAYAFPLRLAPGLPDHDGFRVSAFVDHDPAVGATLDYDGGTRTYDGHKGTDYALWPFAWNKLDAGDMQVVAAAPGTIAYKTNVDPTDHNCGAMSPDPWNGVGVVHADGRLLLYGHMRYNSLTPKLLGDTVEQGEYLGTVASSGNSSGPHLHLEGRYGGFASNEWFDPYAGPMSQAQSFWTSQHPYLDSAINRIATHANPPTQPNACAPTITNLEDSFNTEQKIYFFVYYRDFQGPSATRLSIHRPGGGLHNSWSYSEPATPFATAWGAGWEVTLPAGSPAGTWRFVAAYAGNSYETFFNVDAPTAIALASPNGGEQWDPLEPHIVAWTDNLGGDVNIDLYRDNVHVARLASNEPSDGEFAWTPGAGLAEGAGYSVRVSSVIAPAVLDASNATFGLVATGTLFSDGFE